MDLIASLFQVVLVDIDDTRRTTPGVWHKLPTGELKIFSGVGVHTFTYHKQVNHCECDPGNHCSISIISRTIPQVMVFFPSIHHYSRTTGLYEIKKIKSII